MSKIEVDAVEPQSGTSLTLGASGDTITVPAGATFDSSAATNTLPATVVTTTGTQTLTNKSIATTQLTGTVAASNLGTGTADATTFLRGDQTYAEAGGGKINQVVQTAKTTTFSTSSSSYIDVTGMSVAITPSAASSKVLVTVQFAAGATSGYKFYTTLLRDSTEIYRGNADGSRTRTSFGGKANANDDVRSVSLTFLDSPSTTSATTYKLQGSIESGGVFYVNMSRSSNDTDDSIYSRSASSITVMEVLA